MILIWFIFTPQILCLFVEREPAQNSPPSPRLYPMMEPLNDDFFVIYGGYVTPENSFNDM